MAELFIELFSEEIPAGMQPAGANQLAKILQDWLAAHDLGGDQARIFSTPRRLVCVIVDVKEREPDRRIERRGPRIDAPENAREGFLRGLKGEAYVLSEIEDRKGRFLLVTIDRKGEETRALLSSALPEMLRRFSWPKSMRWGDGTQGWVRPLHRIICLLDGEIIPFSFAGVESDRSSEGHRFMSPGAFVAENFSVYRSELKSRFVMLDPETRKSRIIEGAAGLAEDKGLSVKPDPGLVNELVGLVEWPVPVIGRIEERFMALPEEVLVTSMREHQKFLALEDDSGNLAPWFITIANLEARDGGQTIVAGNEYVLRARLWDAWFFWDLDRKTPLESNLAKLDHMVFHAELGSIGAKTERMAMLARLIAHEVRADGDKAERAALLAKADLTSGMVGEFPELQGVMGGYYASHQGENAEIADAIRDHYKPQGPGDDCPQGPVAQCVALADKIDTLTGFFAAGIRPTGSKDPFALRRAGLGVIRLVLENGLRLSLHPIFSAARSAYGEKFADKAVEPELLSFLIDRLKVHLRGEGMRYDVIEAALSGAEHDDLLNLVERVRALQDVLATEAGAALLAACKRAMNILAIEEKRDKGRFDGDVDAALFESEDERRLAAQIGDLEDVVMDAMQRFDAAEALRALATIREPLDMFFDHVLVNHDNSAIRVNRLNLLASLRKIANGIAAMTLIEDQAARTENGRPSNGALR